MSNDWWCPQCFGSYQPGPAQCKCPEPDGYCEYCCAPNPPYECARIETNVVTQEAKEVGYFFCNEECADNWMNR